MPDEKWFRLVLGLTTLSAWAVVCILLVYRVRDIRKWNRAIVAVMLMIFAAWFVCMVNNRSHLAWLLQLNFCGALSAGSFVQMRRRKKVSSRSDIPPLYFLVRLPNGTPIRAVCPLCGAEFSTEAFDEDAEYPHQARLDEQYNTHAAIHLRDC